LRRLIGLTALAAGILAALYGLFLVAYEGDTAGGEETYVSFGGSKIDADVFGAITIVIAVLVIGVGLALVTRRFASRS
jgi:hypothetical protein